MIYIGIDPGLRGAIAFFNPSTNTITTADMPIQTGRLVKKKARQQTDYITLATLLYPETPVRVFMEHVWSMPNDGAIQAHNFGLNVGALRGVLGSYEITPTLVLPKAWKTHFDLIGKDKHASVAKAVEIFPKNDFFGRRGGIKDGRCEAALIAAYGYAKTPDDQKGNTI